MATSKERPKHRMTFTTCRLGECRSELIPLLSDVSKAVSQGAELSVTLKLVLQLMQTYMHVVRGMVTLYEPDTNQIYTHEAIGLTEDEISRGIYAPGEGITGRVVETGKPVIVSSIADEPAFLNRTKGWDPKEHQRIAFICVPIIRGHVVMGTISVERHYDNRALPEVDREVLSIMATLIAQVVELHILDNIYKKDLLDENRRLRNELKEKFRPSNIIGNSKAMQGIYRMIEKVSHSKTTVLILGESGVGKERVASAIHYNSPLSNGPFVKFNCASLPESVIESELFGHERGSFTGANARRTGRFEEANNGTIFLDEVGELSLMMQAKLLRVLQERCFERVGSNVTIHVNLRILAATNRDLPKMVAEGTFREDLFYRLNVFPMTIPALRERGNDIAMLAEHFIVFFAREQGKEVPRLSTPAMNQLLAYQWPGNVRELENMMERAVLLAEEGVIHTHHLPGNLQPASLVESVNKGGIDAKISQVEYEMIVDALNIYQGNVSEAAHHLGMTRRILGLRMNKYNLSYKQFRPHVKAT
ncbi:sigma-54 interaction domain-containing protein [Celerinatantimonas sp. YJH-8]|uniref:sigma-54 interaction domain-containing protein n=1 Tax=Celerinatantimonas sp. YJH-8 TaxID=3228714 RepID=UPI0038BF90CC